MLHLEAHDITPTLCEFLRVIVEETKVKQSEFEKFMHGLNDVEMADAFRVHAGMLF